MNILITGASGFLGTNLVQELLQKCPNDQIFILVRKLDLGLKNKHPQITQIIGDITLPDTLVNICNGIDLVYHLAGLIGYSQFLRPTMFKVNVEGTKNILEASINSGVKRFIYLSSVVSVGSSFDERHILDENSNFNLDKYHLSYFDSKRAAEQIVLQAAREKKIEVICLNPGTIYGPGSARKSSRGFQSKVAQGKMPFYTSGGVNVVALKDVLHCLIQAQTKGHSGERYIIGGENLKIKDLFNIIAQISKVRPPHIYIPNFIIFFLGRIGDLQTRMGMKAFINYENAFVSTLFHWFNSDKAQNEFSYKPTPAFEAIRSSLD